MIDDHDLLIETSDRSKANQRRIERLECDQQILLKMSSSLDVMANEQKHIRSDLSEVDKKVQQLDAKPGKRWESIMSAGITGVVGVLVGAIVSLIVR